MIKLGNIDITALAIGDTLPTKIYLGDNEIWSSCIYGCTDPEACNYDPLATCDDGSCLVCPMGQLVDEGLGDCIEGPNVFEIIRVYLTGTSSIIDGECQCDTIAVNEGIDPPNHPCSP